MAGRRYEGEGMLTREVNVSPDLAGIDVICRRHKMSDGFCRCCNEPWPCDVTVIGTMLFREKR